MTTTTIDAIVRRWLLESGLPIHYYAEGLFHASTCLRELTIDTLKVVNTKNLPLTDYYAVELPSDFVDDVMVGIPVGDRYQPVPKVSNLNPLRQADSDGNFTAYPSQNQSPNNTGTGLLPSAIWYWNFNQYGEPTGKFYGIGGGQKLNGYQVFKERGEIQLTGTFTSENILLMYISDGQSIDAASQIDTLAFTAIQSWIAWKRSPNRSNNLSPEGQMFWNQRRILRARLNELTTVDIKETLRKNYRASIKT